MTDKLKHAVVVGSGTCQLIGLQYYSKFSAKAYTQCRREVILAQVKRS